MATMPVIVVGADTAIGDAIVAGLLATDQEVRAFVTDPAVTVRLKEVGVKVATGDVSDASHVAGACTNVFTAVLVTAAAEDGRERSFGATPRAVMDGWAEAVNESSVPRVIWVADTEPPVAGVPEEVVVPSSLVVAEVVSRVVDLDSAGTIPSRR
jgi:uncharacterized protein YbjT (DUF2867 family)